MFAMAARHSERITLIDCHSERIILIECLGKNEAVSVFSVFLMWTDLTDQ